MTGRNPKFEWQDAMLMSSVPDRTKIVAQAIVNRWNGDDKRMPLVTVESLMKRTGKSRRTVERALSELRETGWVAQVRRGGKRGGESWPSKYRPTYPNPNPPLVTPQPATSDAQPATSGALVDPLVDPPSVDPRPLPVLGSVETTDQGDARAREKPHPCTYGCRWVKDVGPIPMPECGGSRACSSDEECERLLWRLVSEPEPEWSVGE